MKAKQINFRVAVDVHAALEKGAADAGMTLSTWLTVLGLTAIGKSKLSGQLANVARAPRAKKKR